MTKAKRARKTPRTEKRMVASKCKHALAVQLRVEGYTLLQIAKRCGYADAASSHRAIISGLKEIITEPSEQLRTIMSKRYEVLFSRAMAKVNRGNLSAIPVAMNVVSRICRLHGLDEAQVHEVRGSAEQPLITITLPDNWPKRTPPLAIDE